MAKAEKEKNKLESEIDPEWHVKFNNQKEYYESRLSTIQSELENVKTQRDSIKQYTSKTKIDTNENIVLSLKTARKVLKKIVQGQTDSALLSLYIEQDSLQNHLIRNKETQILNLQAVNSYKDKIIELYEYKISEYEEQNQIVQILFIATAFLLILSLIVSIYFKKINNDGKKL